MSGGKNTAHHPGRVAENWRPIRPGNQSTAKGDIVSALELGEGEYTHRLDVTQHRGGAGFSAGLDYVRYAGQHGIESEQYAAGPFKTQRRAEIAGVSLHDRAEAESARAADYQVGEQFESADEIRANRAGLL